MHLNHLKTSTATCRPFVEKLSSTKQVPGAKKIGGHNTRGLEPIIEQERRKKESEVAQLCLTLCDPVDYSPPGSSNPRDSPGKNTGVGCHFLHQGIFPS